MLIFSVSSVTMRINPHCVGAGNVQHQTDSDRHLLEAHLPLRVGCGGPDCLRSRCKKNTTSSTNRTENEFIKNLITHTFFLCLRITFINLPYFTGCVLRLSHFGIACFVDVAVYFDTGCHHVCGIVPAHN